MQKLENRSLFFYLLIAIVVLIPIILFLSIIDAEGGAVIAGGLITAVATLIGSLNIPSHWKYGRLLLRFAALQSACVGIYLWNIELQNKDVEKWYVGFFLIVFVILPIGVSLILTKLEQNRGL